MRYNRHFTQQATYWPPGSPDGFGGISYGTPVEIMCRWQSDNALYRDAEGQEFTASSVVYLSEGIEVKGQLAKGHHSTMPDGAREIRNIYETVTLDGRMTLTKAIL